MKFATLPDGTADGRLHLVSRDLTRAVPCAAARTLQAALDWSHDLLSPDEQRLRLLRSVLRRLHAHGQLRQSCRRRSWRPSGSPAAIR